MAREEHAAGHEHAGGADSAGEERGQAVRGRFVAGCVRRSGCKKLGALDDSLYIEQGE